MEVSTSYFYDLANFFVYIINLIGHGLCLSYFLQGFLKERFFSKITTVIFITLIYAVARFCTEELFPREYHLLRSFGRVIVCLAVILLIIHFLYVSASRLAIFLGITFMAISEISLFIAYTIIYLGGNISYFWVWCMDRGLFSSMDHFMMAVEISLILLFHLQQLALLGILFFSLRKIIKDFYAKEYFIQPAELRFLLLPGLTGLFLCIFLRIIIITVERDIPQLLYQKYPVLALFVPAIMVLSLFSILVGIKLFQDMLFLQWERNNRIILEQQLQILQKQTAQMEQLYSGLRGLKHDMKNTMAVLMQLVEESQEDPALNQELEIYLTRLKENIEAFDTEYNTGNRVADTLLKMKQYEISCWNPDLRIEAEALLFPAGLSVESYDLAVILGNALDNAVEACRQLEEEEPGRILFIRLSSFVKNGLFFLEISNSFNGRLKRDALQEFPDTTKGNADMHGIGMMNIKTTAEKYDGDVDWAADEGVFCLTVMVKIQP